MERQFKVLLAEFRKLPSAVSRPPTFMEVAGYPHYENVCSNILAFFFDPNNPHGFGSLLLEALAEAASINSSTDGAYANVSVEREVSTDARNRIDILIESDTFHIGIENKIFHPATNPFADYAAFIEHHNVNDKTICKFLLTLEPSNAGMEYGFLNLTYPQFIDAIRQRIGRGAAYADTRYLVLLLDFLNTFENILNGTHMELQFVEFLAKSNDDVVALLKEVGRFRGELRTKVRELGALINLGGRSNIRQWLFRDLPALWDALVHDITVSNGLPVAIDMWVGPDGWEIQIFLRPRPGSDQENLRSLLQSLEIPFEEGEKLTYPKHFPYTEPLECLQPVLQELIDKIAGFQ
jgi:hypothetical protein